MIYKRKIINFLSQWIMIITMGLIIIIPVIIFVHLYYKSLPLFENTSVFHILFSSKWFPGKGEFGFAAFLTGSLMITIGAIIIAAPVCLFTAVYLTQYASERYTRFMQPVIDILAGIPSVIYGVWGIIVIVPIISDYIAPIFNIHTSGYTLFAASIVLAVMIIPFILNILIEIFKTLPGELTEATLSLGATKWEVIKHVLLRKAKTGIISAFGLGLSRAFGETIAILMVAGNVVHIPKSFFDPVYPIPALIANNYGEMMTIPKYDAALMTAALILFCTILLFNFLSRITIYHLEKKI